MLSNIRAWQHPRTSVDDDVAGTWNSLSHLPPAYSLQGPDLLLFVFRLLELAFWCSVFWCSGVLFSLRRARRSDVLFVTSGSGCQYSPHVCT